MSSPRARWAFIDGARALAMLLMLQGHSADNLLVPAARATAFFTLYWRLRGVTAPLFLALSGFALVVASEAHWEEYRRASPALARRLWRAAQLVLVALVLQLPRWTGRPPFDFTGQEWRDWLRCGILQVIAVGIAAACALAAAAGRRAFAAASAVLGGLAFGAATLVAQPFVQLPAWAALALRFEPGSYFPLVPWLGYFFLGLAAGRVFLDGRPRWPTPRRFGAALGAAGGALLASGFAWDLWQPDPFVGPAHWVSAPSLFLMRLGAAWLIVAAFALALGAARSPRPLAFVSGHALSIYVAHLVVLYGPPAHFELGLIARLGATVPPSRIFLAGPALFLSCAAAIALGSRLWRALGATASRRLRRPEIPAAAPPP